MSRTWALSLATAVLVGTSPFGTALAQDASAEPAGGADPATEAAPAQPLPAGSWQVELTTDELIIAGAPVEGTQGGRFRWTFDGPRAVIDVRFQDGSAAHCEASSEVVEDYVRLTYGDGSCGGEVDDIRWSMAEDGLHLDLLATNAPFEVNEAYLEAEPWQPVERVALASGRPACPEPDGGSCLGELPAGTHVSTSFTFPLSFAVPDGWYNYEDFSGEFILLPPGGWAARLAPDGPDYVGLFAGVRVQRPGCSGSSYTTTVSPLELATNVSSLPGVVASEPSAVRVGGLAGYSVDVRLDPEWTQTCPWWDRPTSPLIMGDGRTSFFEHSLPQGQETRLIFLEAPLPVAIEITHVPGQSSFNDLLAEVQPVLDSLDFDTGA